MTLATLIFIAGVLHLGLLIASFLTPQVLDWGKELRSLHPMTRHLIWVHGTFIVLTIIGFGILSLTCATPLASGERLARVLCGFIAVFWLARLGIQLALFDAKPLLTSVVLKVGYHGLTAVFTYFAIVYGMAALAPSTIGGAR
jgi:hypothetical protein